MIHLGSRYITHPSLCSSFLCPIFQKMLKSKLARKWLLDPSLFLAFMWPHTIKGHFWISGHSMYSRKYISIIMKRALDLNIFFIFYFLCLKSELKVLEVKPAVNLLNYSLLETSFSYLAVQNQNKLSMQRQHWATHTVPQNFLQKSPY